MTEIWKGLRLNIIVYLWWFDCAYHYYYLFEFERCNTFRTNCFERISCHLNKKRKKFCANSVISNFKYSHNHCTFGIHMLASRKKWANLQIWANHTNCDLWSMKSNEKKSGNRIENMKINSINWYHWICVICKRFFRLAIPQLERSKSPNKSLFCTWATECQKLIFLLGRCFLLNVQCGVHSILRMRGKMGRHILHT